MTRLLRSLQPLQQARTVSRPFPHFRTYAAVPGAKIEVPKPKIGDITITEVGPRDGLQNEKNPIPLETKLRLIKELAKTGLKQIEAGSFVAPKWVPQMANSGELAEALVGVKSEIQSHGPGAKGEDRGDGVRYSWLVPNERGLKGALGYNVEEVAVFVSASEGFSRKNLNCSVEESMVKTEAVVKAATDAGVRVRGYVSMVIACPYDGPTAPEKVGSLAQRLIEMGCYEVSLGDTTGVGRINTVSALLHHLLTQTPLSPSHLACHFHDTYGQALANTTAALHWDIKSFDSAVGGLGGCPYAKGATGNVATEDLVWFLEGVGVRTGVDLERLSEVGRWIAGEVGRGGSRAGKAVLAGMKRD